MQGYWIGIRPYLEDSKFPKVIDRHHVIESDKFSLVDAAWPHKQWVSILDSVFLHEITVYSDKL